MKKLFYDIWKGIGVFREADCFNRAAAISFYALFSLIPLMLLLTAGVGFILGSQAGAMDKVIAFVKQSLPYLGDRVIGDLKGLSKGWKALGWVGVISLVWSAEFVLDALATALAAVFGMTHKLGFFRKKIINLLVVLIALVAAIASLTMTATARILKAIDIKVYGVDVADYFIESITFKYVLPAAILIVSVAFVYRMFAGPNLNIRRAFAGSIMFTALWEAAKHLFALYIANFQTYNRFYASLGALMILMAWIFFSVSIFLFSASYARASFSGGKENRRV